jgi:hypothetical protein
MGRVSVERVKEATRCLLSDDRIRSDGKLRWVRVLARRPEFETHNPHVDEEILRMRNIATTWEGDVQGDVRRCLEPVIGKTDAARKKVPKSC